MQNKRKGEYYLHKDKNTGNIKLFTLTDGVFKIKKRNDRNINKSLGYIINTANYMENINLYTKISLTNDEIKLMKNAKNIFYNK